MPKKPQATSDIERFQLLKQETADLLDDFLEDPAIFAQQLLYARDFQGYPEIKLSETKDALVITAYLPGLTEKDMDLELRGDKLILRGKKISQAKEETLSMIEGPENFIHSIHLPYPVDKDYIEATYDQNLLKVKLPKLQETRSDVRKIKIQILKNR